MRKINYLKLLFSLTFLGLLASGCQYPTSDSNARTPSDSSSTSSGTEPVGIAIQAREPEQYQATLTLQLKTTDQQDTNLPSLSAQAARNGADRRLEFTLPKGEKIIYLNRADKHLLISPDRKEFAELNKESVGFELQQMMNPGQIVERVKNLKGFLPVGEEKVNGRNAIKYKFNSMTPPGAKESDTNTESFVFVDKETSLPLRSDTISQSGIRQVQGVKAFWILTEISNIQTSLDPELFAEPKDFKQVALEEMRAQLDLVLKGPASLLIQIMQNQQPAKNTTVATPRL